MVSDYADECVRQMQMIGCGRARRELQTVKRSCAEEEEKDSVTAKSLFVMF